jgi:catechol 2,3-dioxygenase
MTVTAAAPAPTGALSPLLPVATRLGPVRIAVTDGDRALAVWRDMVGLTETGRSGKVIRLGAGARTLIELETGASRPVAPRTIGLYHVAIHLPTRRDFAVAVKRMFSAGFRNAPTDHLVSEATYLWDLDGNGIELTFETPWRGRFVTDADTFYAETNDGRRVSGRDPIDLTGLFGEIEPGASLSVPMPPGTRVGHVHLHVGDLDAAMGFYSDAIGFQRQAVWRGVGMADVIHGYQPHILAFNLWAGRGAPLPPPGSAGLRHFTIVVPEAADLLPIRARLAMAGARIGDDAGGLLVTDPAGNRLRIVAGQPDAA